MNITLPPALLDFMRQHHYLPDKLKWSGGGFHRFKVGSDTNREAAGFVKVFREGKGAIFGDFKSGDKFDWHAEETRGFSPAEHKAHCREVEQARQEAQRELDKSRSAASGKAAELYVKAGNARANHPYLLKKRINPYGDIRQSGRKLLVPVRMDDRLASLQFIAEDGTKQFLSGGETKGGFCLLGLPRGLICIAEGYATACSIHEASGHAVAVAFTAGNLLSVAEVLRARYSEATLIICADNDQWTDGNPGLTRATEAAQAVDGLLAVPDFSGCDVKSGPTDFNDLHGLTDKESVKKCIASAAKVSGADDPEPRLSPCPRPQPQVQPGTRGPAGRAVANSEKPEPEQAPVDNHVPVAPPRMAEAGFPPLMRDIVEVACESSEAHRVAVAANFLAYFCAMMGRSVYQRIGDAVIHCRPFPLIVGKSGKARKGTAEATVHEIFKHVEPLINKVNGRDDFLQIHNGSLSTGEGIAMQIRDASEPDEKGKGGDPGCTDKRLLAIESEFDNVFSHLRRDNNTLSATIRNLFDGRDLKTLTKNNPIKASLPHVCIMGHITGHELRLKSTENDVANGLLNRFMILYVYREKLVPLPRRTPPAIIERLAQRVADALLAATGGDLLGNNLHEVTFSDAASELWEKQYRTISRDRDGKGGSLLARSEMYVRMLAMAFAAMDGRHVIEPKDLEAGIAWLDYWNASVTYIYNCLDDEGGLDPFVDEVRKVIKAQPGISLNTLQAHWQHKRMRQVNKALEVLLNLAPPFVEERKVSTPGRPARTYHPYEEK